MKKLLILFLSFLLPTVLCAGCAVENLSGSIRFYNAPTRENEPATVQHEVTLTPEEARQLRTHLDSVDEWTDDRTVDRLAYSFDGDFTLSDSEWLYYFTDEYSIVYYDHYFAEVPGEMLTLLRKLRPSQGRSGSGKGRTYDSSTGAAVCSLASSAP